MKRQTDRPYAADENRRTNLRYTTSTLVSIQRKSRHFKGKCVNLSANGALVHVEGLHPKKGDVFTAIFAVRLNNGRLIKLHFREAIVCHVTAGNIGLLIGHKNAQMK